MCGSRNLSEDFSLVQLLPLCFCSYDDMSFMHSARKERQHFPRNAHISDKTYWRGFFFFPFGNNPKSITTATARKVCDCRQGTPRPVSAPAYFDELPAPAEAPDCVCIKASASRVVPRSRKINLVIFAFSGICSSS